MSNTPNTPNAQGPSPSVEPDETRGTAAPAPSTKPRGLHERLGTESFRALRRGMRADWMAMHGLDEAPPSSPWLTNLERFWLLALGLPMPEGAYDPPATLAGYLAAPDAPDAMRRHQLKAADAVFCLPRDHSEVFAREGRECVFVAQPYFNDRLKSLTSLSNVWQDTASKHGLEFTFSLGHSWYDPGRSVLLALWLPRTRSVRSP
jgi:hypothetical protein